MRFKRRKLEISPPYVSMADIAFNLVLFFLILAQTRDDSHLQWSPVKADKEAILKQVANPRLIITVDKNNKIYLNGTELGQRDIAQSILRELGENTTDNRTVLLKIHSDTQASTFEPILEAVSETGCEVIHVLQENLEP
ncbi:MAG: biopolymer transporter ExbD [Planctomycetes bacterium]|nr:biopolymer transporter ExbD [Planctomycetota bacterium]